MNWGWLAVGLPLSTIPALGFWVALNQPHPVVAYTLGSVFAPFVLYMAYQARNL